MVPRFSIVYPTRDRPAFVRQALRILEGQGYADFEVIVSDNVLDPSLSCEAACRETPLPNVRYVRPPRPVGMIENWNHALTVATGEYVLFLTDKMFVLPRALGRIHRAVEAAGDPDVVSWTSDFYKPATFPDYFGAGIYATEHPGGRESEPRAYDPAEELDRRGLAAVSRNELSAADYCRGKIVFGAYRREMVERIVGRFGALFHNINPDYTSMVLGLSVARGAIELAASCVVSVNTDISNGVLADTDDAAALGFLNTLAGGAEAILPNLFVPGLYASVHNWVAHDLLTLKRTYDLLFRFDEVAWLAHCHEDLERPGRRWSSPNVEAEQKRLWRDVVAALAPDAAAKVHERVAATSAKPRPSAIRSGVRRAVPGAVRRWRWRMAPSFSPSLERAIARGAGEAG